MATYQIQIVNCWSLNVRAGTSTSFKVVQWVQRNEIYTSSKQANGWYYIDAKGGWSSGKYIKVLKDLTPVPKPAPKPTPVPAPAPPKPTPPPPAPPKPIVDYGAVGRALAERDAGTDLRTFAADTRVLSVAESNPKIADWKPEDIANTFGSKNFDVSIADYKLDYDFIKSNMDIVRRNYNIRGESYNNIRENLFERFNRFKTAFPDYHLSKTFPHVFFTRPSCFMLTSDGKSLRDSLANDPLFYHLYNNNPNVIKSLTTKLSSTHDFHPYLSNAANSFELSDEFIKTTEHGETYTGYKVQYGRHNIESNTAGQFAVNYQEDAEFNIYKTHKAWTEYISRVYRGTIKPHEDNITKKILDYASSVYYFVCGADGETILFWTKFFGVFPLNTPASAGSWARGSSPKLPEFSINYAYAMKEDFSPLSLAEFNMNCSSDFVYRKVYEPVLAGTGRTMSGAPFVATEKDAQGRAIYKLKFRT